MSRVQILGTGCAKCEKLADRARQALEQLGSSAELVKVQDIPRDRRARGDDDAGARGG
jgi:hypothetical protein